MSHRTNRREFLRTGTAAGLLAGVGDLGFLSHLRPVSAAEATLDPKVVRLDSSVEPLVRLIEETPREKLIEEVGTRVRKGLSYRELLAALQLAGVRNVQPRPSVGFKFHAVLCVNSCHIASQASPDEHRWLPIFWALDYFKSAAARDVRENDWTMGPVDESAVPKPHKAREEFVRAMESWDESAADAAVAGLARSAGANEIFEMFCRYGARDFRSIGHKAIFVANSYRTLQAIGWQHAEPVLRSLAYALQMHEGGNPADRDDPADVPYRRNRERLAKVREDWRTGKTDDGTTKKLLSTLRSGSSDDVCDQAVEMLNAGVAPQSVWDALFVMSGECLARQPGIIALHMVTTTNALNFAFRHAGENETRLLAMLQNAAFLPMFRDRMSERGRIKDMTIDDLQASAVAASTPEGIFEQLRENPMEAASRTLGYLNESQSPRAAAELMDAARVLVFLKGDDAHDYKFSSAVLEDYRHVSPNWRNVYLASNVFNLHGTTERDNALVGRIRSALS